MYKLQEDKKWYFLWPHILLISLVPLMVYLKVVPLESKGYEVWTSVKQSFDFFSYYKMFWILTLTGIAVFLFCFLLFTKEAKLKKTFLYIPIGVYSVFVILSSLFSFYNDIAMKGFIERYEGMYVLLAYMIILFISIHFVNDKKHIGILLASLCVSATVLGILGVFQYFGYDLFQTMFGKKLILPAEFEQYAEQLKFRLGENVIYGTLYHSNYVGSYMAMLFPLSLGFLLLLKGRNYKILCAFFSVLMFVNLLGSKSRGGILGVFFAVIILIILLRKQLLKYWYVFLMSIVGVGLLLVIMNQASSGALLNKMKTLTIDPKSAVQVGGLRDISIQNNEVKIVTTTETLKIKLQDNKVLFKDEKDSVIPAKEEEEKIALQDPRYKLYSAQINNRGNEHIINLQKENLKVAFLGTSAGFKMFNHKGETVDLKPIQKWGFEGKETLGSSRGYIWSRSIPLLKDTFFIGFGPDTFPLYFPQDDYVGKLISYGTMNMLVDKAHNLYLQTAINTGLISLLALLVVFGVYFIWSFKLYLKNDFNDFYSIAGVSIFLAFCGYVVAGFFNDSVVSVAPVFWTLLGIGISINMKLDQVKR